MTSPLERKNLRRIAELLNEQAAEFKYFCEDGGKWDSEVNEERHNECQRLAEWATGQAEK